MLVSMITSSLVTTVHELFGLLECCKRHVAFLLYPVIVLLGKYCLDKPDDGFAVWEDAHYVGASADLSV